MADQAALNGGRNVKINSPLSEGVIGGLGELAGDVSTLAELQVQLAITDLKASAGRAAIPAALLAAGLVLLLGAVPVAMIGASELTADWLALAHRGWAYLIVAGVAAALTLLLVLIGLPRLLRSFESLVNTREELSRNIAWVKTVLANSGRMPTPRRR